MRESVRYSTRGERNSPLSNEKLSEKTTAYDARRRARDKRLPNKRKSVPRTVLGYIKREQIEMQKMPNSSAREIANANRK